MPRRGPTPTDLVKTEAGVVQASLCGACAEAELGRLREGAALERLADEVARLHVADARHKRGFRLSERSPEEALWHLVEEVSEVGRARTDEERTSELGDVLKLVMHYAIRAGLDVRAAAAAGLAKVPEDFPGEPA